jgi:hypothetical protein
MRIGRRRGCGINAIERGHPRKFLAYGGIGWWNVYALTGQTAANINGFVDQFGGSKDATQATDANRWAFNATGWNGKPCADTGAGTTKGYVTPSVTFGTHSFLEVWMGTNGAAGGFLFSHTANMENYIWSAVTPSSRVFRGSSASTKEVTLTWLRDGVRKTFARTFDGTHATHRIYLQGLDVAATNGGSTSDPGTATVTDPLFIGTRSGTTGVVGSWGETVVYSKAMPPPIVKRMSNRQRALWPC